MYTYKLLPHLPQIPQELLDQVYSVATSAQKDITLNPTIPEFSKRVITKDGKQFPSTYTRRFNLTPEVQNWIRENIVETWTECSISRTLSDVSSCHAPHTDKTRNCILMYVLEPGGEDCFTAWYQEKGHPIERPGRLLYTVNDFDKLVYVDKVKLPVKQWAIINTEIIHGVENITQDRLVIHVGLDTDNLIKGM
jgi:hypothetical protein